MAFRKIAGADVTPSIVIVLRPRRSISFFFEYEDEIQQADIDLAQMTVWIGWLQWIRVNGFGFPAEPILRALSGNIRLMDAILDDRGTAESRTAESGTGESATGVLPVLKSSTGVPPVLKDHGQDAHATQPTHAAIAEAARELNELRENWLNPGEWTRQETLEFPGTVGGPWDRYIDPATVEDRGAFKVGAVRYPRLVPRDSECALRLKKRTLTNLYNERPAWLASCHQKLDTAVAAAYGFPADLPDEQILERLLELNLASTK